MFLKLPRLQCICPHTSKIFGLGKLTCKYKYMIGKHNFIITHKIYVKSSINVCVIWFQACQCYHFYLVLVGCVCRKQIICFVLPCSESPALSPKLIHTPPCGIRGGRSSADVNFFSGFDTY